MESGCLCSQLGYDDGTALPKEGAGAGELQKDVSEVHRYHRRREAAET